MIKTSIAPMPTDQCAELVSEQCGLNRELGECALRREGCMRLIDVLSFIHPPYSILALLRAQRAELPADAQAWLRRLDSLGQVCSTWRR
mgnify:CR=1 FL=1